MGQHQAGAGTGRARLRAPRALVAGLLALCAVPTAPIDPESQVAAGRPAIVCTRCVARSVSLPWCPLAVCVGVYVCVRARARRVLCFVCARLHRRVQGGENVKWRTDSAPEHLSQLLGWKDLGIKKIKVFLCAVGM